MIEQTIKKLVEGQKEKFALARDFYHDPEIYDREVDRIFLKAWLYAGHQSEIPNVGDWFLYDIADESVIIVRSGEDEVRAHLNVCRHRGSRICVESSGCSRHLRCRYHGWSYGLDGKLAAAAHMGDDFDKSEIRLKAVHVALFEGMIFINFADDPAPFDAVRDGLCEVLRPYDLGNAKVAHRQSYPINSNWKLAVENYCECYHCAPAHPEYSKGHSLAQPDSRTTELNAEVMARAASCGLSEKRVGAYYRETKAFGVDYLYERYALWRGHLTGSPDGKPVAPLLGAISDFDGGATDLQIGPVCFGLMYCDHVVIYRFTPLGQHRTDCDITWLVRGDAEEGEDYDRERLTWLWDVTTHADKTIIERNQQGVSSRFYEPGPLSTMEDYQWAFLSWYLEVMATD